MSVSYNVPIISRSIDDEESGIYVDDRVWSPQTVEKLNDAILNTSLYTANLFKIMLESRKSFVVSPLLCFSKLAAMIVATEKETKNQITNGLFGLEEMDNNEECLMVFQTKYHQLWMKRGREDSLRAVSFLVVHQDVQVADEFKDSMDQQLGIKVRNLAFNEDAPSVLGSWMEEASGIPTELHTSLGSGLVDHTAKMLMVDFSYFSGQWKYPFVRNDLITQFRNGDSSISTVNFLNAVGTFERGYSENFDCDIIQIPYHDECVTLTLLVPLDGDLDETFLESPEEPFENFSDLLDNSNLESTDLTLWVPEFSLETKCSYRSFLEQFGISHVFDEKLASFAKIAKKEVASGSIFLQDLVQGTIFEVREKSNESSAREAKGREMFVCNCPFAFVVSCVIDGRVIVLYQGAVQELTEA